MLTWTYCLWVILLWSPFVILNVHIFITFPCSETYFYMSLSFVRPCTNGMKVCWNDLKLFISYWCHGQIIAIVNQRLDSQQETLGYHLRDFFASIDEQIRIKPSINSSHLLDQLWHTTMIVCLLWIYTLFRSHLSSLKWHKTLFTIKIQSIWWREWWGTIIFYILT